MKIHSFLLNLFKIYRCRDCPGGPAVRTPGLPCRRNSFEPWSGLSDLSCPTVWPKINRFPKFYFKVIGLTDFPGGAVDGNPPVNAEDTGSIPGPGRSHVPGSNQACAPQLPSPRAAATEPRAEAAGTRARSPSSATEAAAARSLCATGCHKQSKPPGSDGDPAQLRTQTYGPLT